MTEPVAAVRTGSDTLARGTGGPDGRVSPAMAPTGTGRFLGLLTRYPRIAALVLGAAAALGFPPLGLWPVAFAAMGLFVVLAEARRERVRGAFTLGWLFGLAHFTLTNNWIATAFTFQAAMPPALGWVAVPLLSAYLAVYPGLAAGAAAWLTRGRSAGTFVLLFAATWIVAEWLRATVFTGYAWGPFALAGLGGFGRPGLAVLLPLTGTYALSGLLVLVCGVLGLLAVRGKGRSVLGAVALGSAVLAVAMLMPPLQPARQGTLPVTVVQPDRRQTELNDPTRFEQQFRRIAALSAPRAASRTRLVLWPESGVPDYLRSGYPQRYYDQMTAMGDPFFARWRIGQAIGPGSLLLTGAVDLEIADGRAVGAYNSVTAIGADGALRAGYRKAHLVPYGEYLALRWLLEPLGATRLVAGSIDFIPGPGPRTLELGEWGQAGIQICYEIIFSGEVVDPANRPDYLFNPSNDGWFGAWGPPQHLGQARLRAIEEGLPVLRATTTGISAVIDARGVVRAHLPLHRADRIDTIVPPAAAPTPFSRLGHWLTLVWVSVLAVLSVVVTRRAQR